MEQPKLKRRIRFFHSFEEMNESDNRDAAALSSVEHLTNGMQLIKMFAGYKGGRTTVRKIIYIGYGYRPY